MTLPISNFLFNVYHQLFLLDLSEHDIHFFQLLSDLVGESFQPRSYCNPHSHIIELVKRLGYSIMRSVFHLEISSINKSLND